MPRYHKPFRSHDPFTSLESGLYQPLTHGIVRRFETLSPCGRVDVAGALAE